MKNQLFGFSEQLPLSGSRDSGDFTVEMETGTGKTYVYLRTIFELNKRYDFTKFVIVDEPQSVDGGLLGAGKTALDAGGRFGGENRNNDVWKS